MRYFVTLPSGREIAVDLSSDARGEQLAAIEGRSVDVDLVQHAGGTSYRVEGRVVDLTLEGKLPDVGVVARERRFHARVESERARALGAVGGRRSAGSGAGRLTSPMPGRVLKLHVAEGEVVAEGAPVIVVEAMKMENELTAPRGGRVKKLHVSVGATIEGGALLVEIDDVDPTSA